MEDIYLVIIAWGDIDALDSDIKDNKNIIIVGKDSLEKAYTPTLVTRPQFYDNMLQGRDKISQEVMERVNERYRILIPRNILFNMKTCINANLNNNLVYECNQ
ncbi:unnamed protein product [Rhizophagus irregularis]|nr:unnamed protein product [Rhizophagus irregularis]